MRRASATRCRVTRTALPAPGRSASSASTGTTGWCTPRRPWAGRHKYERIVRVDDQQVTLRVRADTHGGKRIVKLAGVEFVRRFMRHVLPTGIKRIRHYGLLAPAGKRIKLAQVREALSMPAANPVATESAQAFMQRVAQQDILQ